MGSIVYAVKMKRLVFWNCTVTRTCGLCWEPEDKCSFWQWLRDR